MHDNKPNQAIERKFCEIQIEKKNCSVHGSQ